MRLDPYRVLDLAQQLAPSLQSDVHPSLILRFDHGTNARRMLLIVATAFCQHFNEQLERALEGADTELLERAAVLLAERASAQERPR